MPARQTKIFACVVLSPDEYASTLSKTQKKTKVRGAASLRMERNYHRICQLVRGLQIWEVILRTKVPRCGSLSGDELGRGQQKEQREKCTVKTQTLPGTGCSFNVFLSVSLC